MVPNDIWGDSQTPPLPRKTDRLPVDAAARTLTIDAGRM